ncbi:MAG: SufD family Fe-S cluster assembly protein [Candidatus Gracilibacteria bacterium]|nr:SufD family Fe-S cluster assembly protein [Candidatus Gracilibacteria bacterium]
MIIDKNGFYDISNILDNEIIITENLVVSIYDDGKYTRKIYLGFDSIVEYFGFVHNPQINTIEFYQNEENSNLKVKYLHYSVDNKKIKSRIYSNIKSNKSKSDVKILSIIDEKGDIDLDGIIEISKGYEKIVGHLVEENLFLGESGKIKGVPTLLVRSDDVEASHACKIEKISNDKLFYLKSRGVEEKTALMLLLEANIKSIFSCLSMVDNDFYTNLILEITEIINKK